MDAHKSANTWLLNTYERRCQANPKYSLRAFARFLGMSPGRVSEIFNGRRSLTVKAAAKVADRLTLSPNQRNELMQLVRQPKRSSIELSKTMYHSLTEDQFNVIADWYHYAILSLFQVRGFKPDSKWIAERLGLTAPIVNSALARLERLHLVDRSSAKWKLTGENLTTTEDVSSPALRRSHRQSLEQAISSLEQLPVEQRDISSITIALNLKKMPEAKALIRRFRRHFADLIETEDAEEVFNLNIQLVPVTKLQVHRNQLQTQSRKFGRKGRKP